MSSNRLALLILGCLSLGALSACEAPAPATSQTVPHNWGSDLSPDHTDLAYGPHLGCAPGEPDHTCGGSQELDIYLPTAGGNRGAIVYIHGGGFVTGDKAPMATLGNIMRQTERGFSVVSINYRLTDAANEEDGFQDAVDDVARAIRWVRANADRHGMVTDTLLVAGSSAGGTLATLAGTTANSEERAFARMPRVDGWINVSGVLDHTNGSQSRGWFELWLGENFDAKRDLAAPAHHIDPSDPPGYVVHGGNDGFVETANALALEDDLESRADGTHLRVVVDVVDHFHDGTKMIRNTGHTPMGGANAAFMDLWIDNRVDGIAAIDS